jgi:hypothetical protein
MDSDPKQKTAAPPTAPAAPSPAPYRVLTLKAFADRAHAGPRGQIMTLSEYARRAYAASARCR